MERTMCTYCGQEGHRASHCPWRPAKLFGVLLVALAAGCTNGADLGHDTNINVTGPDKHGVVCYRYYHGLSCVKVQEAQR